MTEYYNIDGYRERRELWFETTRRHILQVLNPDGTPRIPQFDSPYRETLWAAAALYTGTQEHIDMINRAIARWHDVPRLPPRPGGRESHGSEFGIFQSNTMTHLYHEFRDKVTPDVEKVMLHHVGHATKTFQGSGQPDTKFHGSNDNMPMIATAGLIFGGEILGDERAVQQGFWNLNQFRLWLSRCAWASEYNSSTYSAVTLSNVAQIATYSHNPEIRELARDIEHRLWAEVLLHYHPPTFRQAGPQSRAYAIDYAGHTHSLQLLFWAMFGEELTGRNVIRSYFDPDGKEVIHFQGCPMQTVAEFVHFLDTEFHLPADVAELITKRTYPARLRGRSEVRGTYDGLPNTYRTETYMEESYSLGTCNAAMAGAEQTASLMATYKLKAQPQDFRDAATVFFKYLTENIECGVKERSKDGQFEGEQFISSRGWPYAIQKDNVGVLLISPSLKSSPITTETLKLQIVFPAHYGKIKNTIIGSGPVRAGAVGESAGVVPVSIEAGEVYINIIPLIPTSLPRQSAVRFVKSENYEVLELINYDEPERTFSREELERVMNGVVFTIEAAGKFKSLEEFHRVKSEALITDYYLSHCRFFEFKRDDAWFQIVYSPRNGGVMTESIDGRAVQRPVFESNQFDVLRLPFMTGPVPQNFPMFPWKDSLEVCWYPENSWIIGARGIPEEVPYSQIIERIK